MINPFQSIVDQADEKARTVEYWKKQAEIALENNDLKTYRLMKQFIEADEAEIIKLHGFLI